MGSWQQSLALFGWPAWPIAAVTTPIGAAISFNVAFRKGISSQWQPNKEMLCGALVSGLLSVLPAMLAAAWLFGATGRGSMGWARAAAAGVLGGCGAGLLGFGFLLIIAARWDLWKRHHDAYYHHGLTYHFLREQFGQRFRSRRKALMDWLYR